MNKKLIFLFIWVFCVLELLVLILIPKNPEIYQVTYLATMGLIFVAPLFLIIIQNCLTWRVFKKRDIFDSIPNVGSCLLMLLIFVNFIGSIEVIAIAQIVTIICLFVAAELLVGYLKIVYKKMSLKQYLWLEVATYLSLVLFFICAMIISVDFGKI